MSKKLKVFALTFAGVLTLAGCSKVGSVPNQYSDADLDINEDWVDYSVPATSISFEEGEINLVLNKGDSYTYSPLLSPAKATLGSVEWESSDTSVVLIEKGTLTAVGGGEAVITVSSPDDYFDDIHLNVTVVVPLESFSLSASSLNLDYNETSKIEVTYTPADTTQRELVWTVSDESIATVDKGLVTAGKKDGSTKLTVHSPVLGNAYDQVVAIDVIDKTVHVSKVFITKNQVEVSSVDVEVTRELQLNAVIEPDNATHKTVVWSSDNASVASVSETGLIKANEVGTTKVKVAAENNKNAEVTVNVFENIPHTFELSDDLKLDTANVKTKQIEITYKDDGGEIVVPSRPVVKYTSSNPEVATVNTSGVVTAVSKGDAIITVEDTKYLLSGTVNVSVVKGTTGIKLSSTSLSIAPEDEFNLTASVIPSDSDQKDITFEITTGEVLVKEFTVVDNTIHVVAGETAGNVVITAKCGNITATCSVKISNEAGAFESSSAYIVGMSSDEEGGFGDYSKPSWGDSRYAFKFTEKTGNQYAIYEWHGLVRFDVGDQWKLREGDTWKNIEEYATDDEGTHQIGRYKLDEGAFAAGQMQALKNDKDEYTNVKVLEEGYYDIYYAYYKDELSPAEGWFDIYVGKHALTLNASSIKAVVNQTSSVKASLFEGTLLASVEDDTIAEVTNIASDGTITVKGLAEGTTKLIVSDDANTLECEIKVVDAASLSAYYLIGDFNGWTTEDVNYNLTQVSENEYEITDVTLTTEMGIKVHNPAGEGTWYSNKNAYEGHSLDDNGNVHVTTNGVYTVHFYVESEYDNHIYAVKTGGTIITSSYYLLGEFNGWNTSDKSHALEKVSDNQYRIASVALDGTAIKIYDGVTDTWYSNASTWDNCGFYIDESGNVVPSASGTYTIDFYLQSDYNNHIVLTKNGDVPPAEAVYKAVIGTNELVLSEVTPSAEETGVGILHKYAGHMNVTKDETIKYYIDDVQILSDFGPNGDGASEYNNFMGTSPANYRIQATATNALVELSVYPSGKSFWISGGDSNVHVEVENMTIYFSNNKGWASVNAYPFNGDSSDVSWPGTSMEVVGQDTYGQDAYAITIDLAKYSGIVFNDGTDQTVNIDISSISNFTGYYLTDKDGEGKYEVGIFNYGVSVADADQAKSVQEGEDVVVQTHTWVGTLAASSSTANATVTVNSSTGAVTIHGVSEGNAVITLSDESNNTATVTVTVTKEAVETTITYTLTWTEEGVYNNGGCNVVAWIYGGGESGKWCDCTYISQNSCSITVDKTITNIIFLQVDGSKSAATVGWSDEYNRVELTVNNSTLNYVLDWPW